ncbi:hypothetical protein [Verrucomicrobium sp. BvORR034]|jgi:hypothetical protein|uniref:hypothetical protein n=1 Tax=Verrucomicrobium sp. BvORR034 TaxID=1396418 RepID=UPI000678BBD4|nr:hypothetical protein [Verrucomicrobium sp. BvORR034]
MKTLLDLPDELLVAARQVAAQRHTTLEDMVALSLRREIGIDGTSASTTDLYEVGEHGFLQLRTRNDVITEELIEQIRESEGI